MDKIKELPIKEIAKNRPILREKLKKIKYVVTSQQLWKRIKKVLMESFIWAGLVSQNANKSLFFVLEPWGSFIIMLNQQRNYQKYFKIGEYCIVCNLGGGTGDIVAYLVDSINEIFPSCGGNFGSNEINKINKYNRN